MRALLCFAALAAAIAFSARAGDAAADTWIISGQSNACGWAEGKGLPSDPRVQMWDAAAKKWIPAAEPLSLLNGKSGAWLAAGLEAAKAGVTVRLMGHASPGQPITYWDESQPGLPALLGNIQACGQGASTFIWYQGESDAIGGTDPKRYQERLRDLVAKVRTAAKNPDMLLIVVQLASWRDNPAGIMLIREAQRQFVASDPKAILVAGLGRPVQADGAHLTAEGYQELGREVGRAILKLRKRPNADWPGPVLDFAALSPDGKTVFAHFAEVKKLAGVLADDFGVVDADGKPVKCEKATAENTRIALSLEKPVRLPARLVYGWQNAPKATLADENGNRAPAVQLGIQAKDIPPDKETPAPNGAASSAEPRPK